MAKHFIRTHAPVTAEQSSLLLQVGIDVSKFVTREVFWGEFTEEQIVLLRSWSWVKSIDSDVQFQPFAVSDGSGSDQRLIVRRTVIGADERIFCAFVNDTLEPGDELFSGTFRRTENWVNIRSRGRSISTTVFEQVGELTLVGFHQHSNDHDAAPVAHEPVVQQLVI